MPFLIKIISILYPVFFIFKKKNVADWIDQINMQAWPNSAWDRLFLWTIFFLIL